MGEYDYKEVQLTLLVDDSSDRREKLLMESLGAIVLDSGCATMVSVEDWLHSYIETLPPHDSESITRKASNITFRFGDGRQIISQGSALIPCFIHGKKVMICTEVEDCRIPL